MDDVEGHIHNKLQVQLHHRVSSSPTQSSGCKSTSSLSVTVAIGKMIAMIMNHSSPWEHVTVLWVLHQMVESRRWWYDTWVARAGIPSGVGDDGGGWLEVGICGMCESKRTKMRQRQCHHYSPREGDSGQWLGWRPSMIDLWWDSSDGSTSVHCPMIW